jgi:Family of unknown function (DUF6151)
MAAAARPRALWPPMATPPEAISLRCACGAVRGNFDAVPTGGRRGACHCLDCQAAARWLGRDDILDAHGATEVLPTWPAQIHISAGAAEIRLLRLSSKGLHRWYAGCCRAPLANSFGHTRLPFTGLIRARLDATDAALLARFGPVHGIQGRYAPGGCPPGAARTATADDIRGVLVLLARGLVRGAKTPSPFFDRHGQPIVAATVLTPEERRAL